MDEQDIEKNWKMYEIESSDEPWQMTIRRVANGYILMTLPNEDTAVLQDNEQDELKSHEGLLWEIMTFFNFGGSKHDPERLRIIRETKEE